MYQTGRGIEKNENMAKHIIETVLKQGDDGGVGR